MTLAFSSRFFLRANKGFVQFRLFGYGLYIKNHTLPTNKLLFSERNGYSGKVIGRYYFEILKP